MFIKDPLRTLFPQPALLKMSYSIAENSTREIVQEANHLDLGRILLLVLISTAEALNSLLCM
jgi:hypothetical protein